MPECSAAGVDTATGAGVVACRSGGFDGHWLRLLRKSIAGAASFAAGCTAIAAGFDAELDRRLGRPGRGVGETVAPEHKGARGVDD